MATVEFENYGDKYRLTSDEVEDAVRGLEPGVIQSLAVEVNGRWFPVKQAFVAAVAPQNKNIKANTDLNSRMALRHLARLGFRTHDKATQGELPNAIGSSLRSITSEDRRLALTLAVELMKRQPSTADAVTGLADELADWLANSQA